MHKKMVGLELQLFVVPIQNDECLCLCLLFVTQLPELLGTMKFISLIGYLKETIFNWSAKTDWGYYTIYFGSNEN